MPAIFNVTYKKRKKKKKGLLNTITSYAPSLFLSHFLSLPIYIYIYLSTRRSAEKFIDWSRYSAAILSNKVCFFNIVSFDVHSLLPLVLQCFDPARQKSQQKIRHELFILWTFHLDYIYIYIMNEKNLYIYIYVCVCVCVCVNSWKTYFVSWNSWGFIFSTLPFYYQ